MKRIPHYEGQHPRGMILTSARLKEFLDFMKITVDDDLPDAEETDQPNWIKVLPLEESSLRSYADPNEFPHDDYSRYQRAAYKKETLACFGHYFTGWRLIDDEPVAAKPADTSDESQRESNGARLDRLRAGVRSTLGVLSRRYGRMLDLPESTCQDPKQPDLKKRV